MESWIHGSIGICFFSAQVVLWEFALTPANPGDIFYLYSVCKKQAGKELKSMIVREVVTF